MKTLLVEEWVRWKSEFFTVLENSSHKKAKRRLLKLETVRHTKKVSKQIASELNEALHSLDADTRERFLRKIRDKKYEQSRVRISISSDIEEKLKKIRKREGLKNYNEVLIHLLKYQRK